MRHKLTAEIIVFAAAVVIPFGMAWLFAHLGEPRSVWLMRMIGVM